MIHTPYDGLDEMTEKIDRMAGNVGTAIRNYRTLEHGGQERMHALADQTLAEDQLNTLRAEFSPAPGNVVTRHAERPCAG